jgi:hypothetical protein
MIISNYEEPQVINPKQNYELIIKLLEEGRYRKYIFDKIAEENSKYIQHKNNEKASELV